MPRSQQSKERRQARYNYLRSLGYSPSDARRLRDQSGGNIESSVRQTQQEITRIPVRQRSRQQQERLNAIRRSLRDIETRVILESNSERRSNWSEWSSRQGEQFPDDLQDDARRLNLRSGRDVYSSHGYRVKYFEYVHGLNASDIRSVLQMIYSEGLEMSDALLRVRRRSARGSRRRRRR